MDGIDLNILRRKVERILGPLFMRPLRMREITEELKDHALEAAEAGEADPIAALGSARMLRRTIGWSFLAETTVFLVTFILFYSFIRIITAGYISQFASFVWIIPNDNYHPPESKLSLHYFFRYMITVIPALIMAIILRRWHFLTPGNKWVRWIVFIGIVVILNTLIYSFFYFGLNTLNSKPHIRMEITGSRNSLQHACSYFLLGLTPWKINGLLWGFPYFLLLIIPIGMFTYSLRWLGIIGRVLILILTAIFMERSDIFYYINGPKWLHYTWYYLCNGIRCFGLGFWIMFYLNIWDHLWYWFGKMHRDRREMDLAGQ